VILWRVLPYSARAAPRMPGGALWFPREPQGTGRHDNPERYGCLYAGETPLSPVAEALAPFRAAGPLSPAMLMRAGLPLTLDHPAVRDAADLLGLAPPPERSRRGDSSPA